MLRWSDSKSAYTSLSRNYLGHFAHKYYEFLCEYYSLLLAIVGFVGTFD